MNKQISTTIGVLIIVLVAGVAGASVLFFNQEAEEEFFIEGNEITAEEDIELEEDKDIEENVSKRDRAVEEDIEHEKELTETTMNKFCKTTSDCHAAICLSNSYLTEKFIKTKEAGISIDYNTIPLTASCVCQSNKCTVVIDEKKKSDIREAMIVNNNGLDSLANLINYKSNIITKYTEEDLAEIGRFEINVNEELIKNKESLAFNINLPGDLNVMVEREEFLRCEDNKLIASHLCQKNQYTWKGRVANNEHGSLFISGNDDGILLSVGPLDLININNSNKQYVYTVTNRYLIVKEKTSF